MCSPCPYSVFLGTPGFLTTDSSPTCLPNSPLYPKSLSHLSLSVPVLTVSDPCPDHNSLKLSLLFSQSSEVKCTGGLEFKANLYQVLAE